MGDALGQNAAEVLRSGITTLYLSQQPDMDDELCFEVVQNGINMWDVHDDKYENDPVPIPWLVLENQTFNICHWYLMHRTSQQVPNNMPHSSDDDPPADPTGSNNDGSTTGIYSSFEITWEGTENSQPSADPTPESEEHPAEEPQNSISGDAPDDPQLTPEQLWELGMQGKTNCLPCPIGDVVGNTLLAILEGSGPYPSDVTQDSPLHHLRFTLVNFQDECYIIKDRDRDKEVYYHLDSLTDTCLPAV